jgi:hypothetical protein
MNQRIIYANENGGVSVIIPAPNCGLSIQQIAEKDVPPDTEFEIVDASEIPSDRIFRNAWEKEGNKVVHNIEKCKNIAHERRREMRSKEFEPHDEIISKRIPGKSEEVAEAARQQIRNKYELMQTNIDAAETVEQIKLALEIN